MKLSPSPLSALPLLSLSLSPSLEVHARQTIPGLFGTPGSSDNKSEPSAPTAKGRDFSVPEFVTCVRQGRGGMEQLQPEDTDGRPLKRLSDDELRRLFEQIDTDR